MIEQPAKSLRFEVSQGSPVPFGATLCDGGVNFAIFSAHSVSATLCLITLSDLQQVNWYFEFWLIFVVFELGFIYRSGGFQV